MKRRNQISGQFAPRLIEMLRSPAYRLLSLSGHMVLARIEIELGDHAGKDNGRLPVTTEDFVKYGMHRTSVAPAIREAEALGFIQITERGHGGNAEHRSPNRFYLTYRPTLENRGSPPSDEWRRINTLEDANRVARTARNNKSKWAVDHGRQSWRKRQQKTKSGTENTPLSVPKNGLETSESPVRDSGTTGSGGETELLSISRYGEHRDQPSPPSAPVRGSKA
jgi:hypothetical protein